MWRGALFFGITSLCLAADEAALLDRARSRIESMLARAPRFTCALDITRQYYQPTLTRQPRNCADLAKWKQEILYGLTHFSTDRLRLDVTVGDQREMFSWRGAASFDQRDLADMLPGPIGTGGYAGFLTNIFHDRAALLTYAGVDRVRNRPTTKFAYAVGLSRTNHKFLVGKQWEPVEYEGFVDLDSETADLLRLTVVVKHPPKASNCCEVAVQLDYAPPGPGAGSQIYLLPAETRHRYIDADAREVENLAAYSACREFQSESQIYFGHPDQRPAAAAMTASLELPANRQVTLALNEPIDMRTAAAGDTFIARVIETLRDARGEILVPDGSLVEGHLTRVDQWHRWNQATVVFQPESVRLAGKRLAITLHPRPSREHMWATMETPAGSFRWRAASSGQVVTPNERKLGVYDFTGENVIVPAGFRTRWITAKP
jgi:hypothetical protein